jgi:signal transduction histidine kinase
MEIFLPELHAFPLRAFLDEGRETLGAAGLTELLGLYGLIAADLTDSSTWVSLAFVESLLEELVKRANDPEFLERCMARGMTPKYIGPLYPLLFALGSPAFTYKQLVPAGGRVNKTGHWSAETLGSGHVRLTWRQPANGPRETSALICGTRLIQLRRVPTLFDLPPASVEHPSCLRRGDDACVYDVRWELPAASRSALYGLGLGFAVGTAAAELSDASSAVWLLGPACAAAGWALGRVFSLRRELRRRLNDIENQNHALDRVTRTNEERFAELLQAKAELDKKVEQRTRELREASQQLSETLTKVQELDRTKTDFFNNVSHELRSPLTLILAPLEELLSGRTPSGAERTAYETMHSNASRLLRLINQLLDLAKFDAGQMKLSLTLTELPRLIRTSLQAFEAAAHKKGVTLTLTLPSNMPTIALDAPWIESAVTNLVANALRLTKAGGGVRVGVEDHESYVTLSVSDDGPGISPDDQKKVFERFAQGDSTKRVIGGSGIGLALVREAARLHGGDVTLVSEVGLGSTFTLTLPRQAPTSAMPSERVHLSLPPTRVLVEEVRDVPAQAADRGGPSSTAPLALLVEDNPELRMFVADVLAGQYRVRAAADGAEGVALARQLRPDVIVSDVAMPEMDGYELCRRLRADESTKAIPVLLVTARTDVNSVLVGFEAGANDYLLKPFHATELLARVNVHVRLRRLTEQLARQERLAALGSLAASVAHNVRNPLSALISGLPAMRARLGAHVDKSTGELMSIMVECAERIERMTLDLLDLSRIDREVSGEFAPGKGLLACTRMFGARLTGSIELRTDVDDLAIASGRPGDMNHACMNLIDNALRAVDPSGLVEVRGYVDNGCYVIIVADSGPGIDPSVIDRVFEPFWTTRAAGEGTGLGLSIARQIIEEHGGTITAGVSQLGGALFTVRLPMRVAARAVA